MGMLKVTSEELVSLSQSLKTGSDQVQAQLDAMRRQVEPVAATWEGAASSSFQQLWQEWQSGAKQVQEALTGISTLLSHAATTYQSAETSIQRSMQS
ncbi:MAG: WXG100 family type VII secretion target [Acidimicrobiales bacterium]